VQYLEIESKHIELSLYNVRWLKIESKYIDSLLDTVIHGLNVKGAMDSNCFARNGIA